MAFWIPMAAMAGAALLKERAQEKATRKHNVAQSELTRYSPWTGMQGELKPNAPNYLGAGIMGGAQGYMLGQAFGGGSPSTMTGAGGVGDVGAQGTAALSPQSTGAPMMRNLSNARGQMNPTANYLHRRNMVNQGPWMGMQNY